ncbi:potassium transporter [Halobacteriales archaeon QS_8_69_26]|nr:MAG: potassium transporter [Halobacteriales archaeon QS_8_69_26]
MSTDAVVTVRDGAVGVAGIGSPLDPDLGGLVDPVAFAAAATGGEVNLLAIVAIIIGAGVVAQVLADRFQVPSVAFLIAFGILLGPEGVGLIPPLLNAFGGNALSAIVGVSVAIIVFEGAFHVRIDSLRQAPAATLRLVTVGAVIALVGTAAVVRFALGTTWAVAFLIGALLVATGPTVITPILQVVAVRDRVATALETEGIVNDVTAAILAVVVFEVIVEEQSAPVEVLQLFTIRLGTGVIVGGGVAMVLYFVLWRLDLSPGNAPQNARLLVLAGAVVAFGIADYLFSEAGVAAVATAGLLLGNLGVPYEEDITDFKGDITLLVLSFVFISLAALLNFQDLLTLGIGGVVVVVAVALVIRPFLVFVSMFGGRFTTSEKLFVSFVGPRGIIPASVATLFAVDLNSRIEAGTLVPATNPLINEGAPEMIVGTVFLVILATVVFEAGLARQIAEYLNVIPMRVLIVGGGKVGRTVATRLEERGENVVIIDRDDEMVQTARNEGFTVHIGDGTDTDQLRAAGADNAKIVVAATGDDDANLLVAQLISSKFDVERVIARANNPDNVDAFEELGVETVSPTLATATAIDNLIERPTLSDWMSELGRTGDVQEIDVTNDEIVGLTIAELDERLPGGVLIALVGRSGETEVPKGEFTIQRRDRLTFIGNGESVAAAIEECHPGGVTQ